MRNEEYGQIIDFQSPTTVQYAKCKQQLLNQPKVIILSCWCPAQLWHPPYLSPIPLFFV